MLCIVVCFCLSPGTYLEYFVLHHIILSIYIIYIIYIYVYIYIYIIYIIIYVSIDPEKKASMRVIQMSHGLRALGRFSAKSIISSPKGPKKSEKAGQMQCELIVCFWSMVTWHYWIQIRCIIFVVLGLTIWRLCWGVMLSKAAFMFHGLLPNGLYNVYRLIDIVQYVHV